MFNKFILSLGKNSKRHIAISVLANICVQVIGLSLTALFVYSLKSVATDDKTFQLAYWLIFAAAALTARFFLVRLSAREAYCSTGNIKSQIRSRLQDKQVRLAKGGKTTLSTAEITQLALEGAEQSETYTSVFLPQFFYSLAAVIVVFTVLCFVSWKTALILLALIPLIPLSVLAVVRFAKKLFVKYWGSYTSMGGDFLDNVQGMTALKIYRADGYMNDKMNKSAEAFRKITMRVLTMQLNSITVMDIIAYGGAAAGIVAAVLQMTRGQITAWQALFVSLVSAEFFLPLRALGSAFHIAMNGITAAKRIEKFLNEPESYIGTKAQTAGGLFSLENVDFAYSPEKPILQNFNMTVKTGEFVCLAGESGSGKSTVAALLTAALNPQSGRVAADDISVFDIDFYKLNEMIRRVSFDSRIFKGTVRSNLQLADDAASDGQMTAALKSACLDEFASAQGLDAPIEEGGGNLSGGQRQRLALARIFLVDAKLYIFDEALSNIDADNERLILENIKKLTAHSAVLFITHRLECCKEADMVYLLKKGGAEIGTHNSLMNLPKSEYAKMYTTQADALKLNRQGAAQ